MIEVREGCVYAAEAIPANTTVCYFDSTDAPNRPARNKKVWQLDSSIRRRYDDDTSHTWAIQMERANGIATDQFWVAPAAHQRGEFAEEDQLGFLVRNTSVAEEANCVLSFRFSLGNPEPQLRTTRDVAANAELVYSRAAHEGCFASGNFVVKSNAAGTRGLFVARALRANCKIPFYGDMRSVGDMEKIFRAPQTEDEAKRALLFHFHRTGRPHLCAHVEHTCALLQYPVALPGRFVEQQQVSTWLKCMRDLDPVLTSVPDFVRECSGVLTDDLSTLSNYDSASRACMERLTHLIRGEDGYVDGYRFSNEFERQGDEWVPTYMDTAYGGLAHMVNSAPSKQAKTVEVEQRTGAKLLVTTKAVEVGKEVLWKYEFWSRVEARTDPTDASKILLEQRTFQGVLQKVICCYSCFQSTQHDVNSVIMMVPSVQLGSAPSLIALPAEHEYPADIRDAHLVLGLADVADIDACFSLPADWPVARMWINRQLERPTAWKELCGKMKQGVRSLLDLQVEPPLSAAAIMCVSRLYEQGASVLYLAPPVAICWGGEESGFCLRTWVPRARGELVAYFEGVARSPVAYMDRYLGAMPSDARYSSAFLSLANSYVMDTQCFFAGGTSKIDSLDLVHTADDPLIRKSLYYPSCFINEPHSRLGMKWREVDTSTRATRTDVSGELARRFSTESTASGGTVTLHEPYVIDDLDPWEVVVSDGRHFQPIEMPDRANCAWLDREQMAENTPPELLVSVATDTLQQMTLTKGRLGAQNSQYALRRETFLLTAVDGARCTLQRTSSGIGNPQLPPIGEWPRLDDSMVPAPAIFAQKNITEGAELTACYYNDLLGADDHLLLMSSSDLKVLHLERRQSAELVELSSRTFAGTDSALVQMDCTQARTDGRAIASLLDERGRVCFLRPIASRPHRTAPLRVHGRIVLTACALGCLVITLTSQGDLRAWSKEGDPMWTDSIDLSEATGPPIATVAGAMLFVAAGKKVTLVRLSATSMLSKIERRVPHRVLCCDSAPGITGFVAMGSDSSLDMLTTEDNARHQDAQVIRTPYSCVAVAVLLGEWLQHARRYVVTAAAASLHVLSCDDPPTQLKSRTIEAAASSMCCYSKPSGAAATRGEIESLLCVCFRGTCKIFTLPHLLVVHTVAGDYLQCKSLPTSRDYAIGNCIRERDVLSTNASYMPKVPGGVRRAEICELDRADQPCPRSLSTQFKYPGGASNLVFSDVETSFPRKMQKVVTLERRLQELLEAGHDSYPAATRDAADFWASLSPQKRSQYAEQLVRFLSAGGFQMGPDSTPVAIARDIVRQLVPLGVEWQRVRTKLSSIS